VELLTITVKEVIVRFGDTGGIADHHCLEVIVRFVEQYQPNEQSPL
jgi:hypothetical protein